MQQPQRGMTLIELMVVLAVLSVIVMLAIPTFFFYQDRAKVTEGMSLVNSPLQAANETFRARGTWPATNSDAGLPQPTSISSKYVKDITVSNTGGTDPRITITYNGANLRGFGTDPTIIFQPDTSAAGATNWTCTAGDMPVLYRPVRCRP